MEMTLRRVLFIETDGSLVRALTRLLNVYDISVEGFNGEAACLSTLSGLSQPAPRKPDAGCILASESDLPVEPDARKQCLERLCRNINRLPVIVVAAKANRFIRAAAMQVGVVAVIERRVLAAFLRRRLADLHKTEPGFDHPGLISLESGLSINFRIMQPEDAAIEQEFVRGLSIQSRIMRFFSPITELSPVWLERFTNAIFPADNALIATVDNASQERIVGVARYGTSEKDGVVDFAIVVADDWQGQGLASMLMSGLIASATIAGIDELTGLVLPQNQAMLQLAASFGFRVDTSAHDSDGVHIAKVLRPER